LRDAAAPAGRSAILRAWRRGFLVALAVLALVAVAVLGGRGKRPDKRPAAATPAIVTVAEAAMPKPWRT
jgi:hypothetical protein